MPAARQVNRLAGGFPHRSRRMGMTTAGEYRGARYGALLLSLYIREIPGFSLLPLSRCGLHLALDHLMNATQGHGIRDEMQLDHACTTWHRQLRHRAARAQA